MTKIFYSSCPIFAISFQESATSFFSSFLLFFGSLMLHFFVCFFCVIWNILFNALSCSAAWISKILSDQICRGNYLSSPFIDILSCALAFSLMFWVVHYIFHSFRHHALCALAALALKVLFTHFTFQQHSGDIRINLFFSLCSILDYSFFLSSFLAALSSSWSLVVCRSVGWLVGR